MILQNVVAAVGFSVVDAVPLGSGDDEPLRGALGVEGEVERLEVRVCGGLDPICADIVQVDDTSTVPPLWEPSVPSASEVMHKVGKASTIFGSRS
jgi:hypothetical protein